MTYLGRGLHMWVTSPRLMLLGALPALVVGTIYAGGIVLLLVNLDIVATWATPFAEGWAAPLRDATRIAAGVALLGAVGLIAVFTFAAVTLLVGDPFYERIWRAVETRLGGAPPEVDEPLWRAAWRSVGGGIRLFALAAAVGILIFALGLVPVLGTILSAVLGAIFGGWILALELSGYAFDARGLRWRDRRRMLGARRTTTLGFGTLTYLLFLVPFGAVVIMPAAVAGATMLSRDALSRDAPGGRP